MTKWITTAAVAAVLLLGITLYTVRSQTPPREVSVPARAEAPDPSGYGGCAAGGSDCGLSGGCASGTGGCGAPADPVASSRRVEQIRLFLLDYDAGKLEGGGELAVKVDDYGCHQEAAVLKGDRVIARLSISGNSIRKMGGRGSTHQVPGSRMAL